jgi:hypothetical protein
LLRCLLEEVVGKSTIVSMIAFDGDSMGCHITLKALFGFERFLRGVRLTDVYVGEVGVLVAENSSYAVSGAG